MRQSDGSTVRDGSTQRAVKLHDVCGGILWSWTGRLQVGTAFVNRRAHVLAEYEFNATIYGDFVTCLPPTCPIANFAVMVLSYPNQWLRGQYVDISGRGIADRVVYVLLPQSASARHAIERPS